MGLQCVNCNDLAYVLASPTIQKNCTTSSALLKLDTQENSKSFAQMIFWIQNLLLQYSVLVSNMIRSFLQL